MESRLKPYCHIYNGEDENPYTRDDKEFPYWQAERSWAEYVAINQDIADEYGFWLRIDFEHELDEFTSIPFYLKATLYNQHQRSGGDKDSFPDFLIGYLNAF